MLKATHSQKPEINTYSSFPKQYTFVFSPPMHMERTVGQVSEPPLKRKVGEPAIMDH